MMFPHLTLVIGGTASGKSDFAERLVRATDLRMIYLASAQAHDDEMERKIIRHQQRRGADWRLVEAPLDAVGALSAADSSEVVLFDCATLWLTNHLLAEHDLASESRQMIDALAACRAPVVVVSNEVGFGGVADNSLARRFATAQGRLNQDIASRADLVVTVIAGLPMTLKGSLPDGLA